MACFMWNKSRQFNRAEYYKMTAEKVRKVLLDSLLRGDTRMSTQIITNCNDQIDFDRLDNDGRNFLHRVCAKGLLESVTILVEAGASLDSADSRGWTPLHISSANSYIEVTKFLLNQGADVMKYSSQGDLPLDVAVSLNTAMVLVEKMVSQGYKDLVDDYLLPLNISKNVVDQSINDLKGQSIYDSINTDIDSNKSSSSQASPEQVGCRFRLSGVDETDEKGDHFNTSCSSTDDDDDNEMTQTRRYTFPSAAGPSKPIGSILKRVRSMEDNTKVRTFEESDKVEDKVKTAEKRTGNRAVTFPSDILCQVCIMDNDHNDLKRLILTEKIQGLDKLYANGISALHLASIEDRPKCAEVLIDCGANINITDPHGWTPLHAAVVAGNIKCVRVLCNKGADLCATTNIGESVFDLAENELIRKYLKMMIIRLVMSQGQHANVRRLKSY